MKAMQEQISVQRLPLKVYRSQNRLTVAAPMPGLQPEDIYVEVRVDGLLIVDGLLRGALKGDKEILMDEWSAGSYHREFNLPNTVDGPLATVTYGNGVLVVTLPLADQTRPVQIELEKVGTDRGERVGSSGHPVRPVGTAEHRQQMLATQLAHGGTSDPHDPNATHATQPIP
jgi:HSP20 family protein